MAAETHSFIDIAALDGVRRHFATGDAVVVLTTDLAQVIWCNGPGAALLGYSGIEAAIGSEAGLGPAARRQIGALPGYPEVGSDRPVAVRLAIGVTSQSAALRASSLTLPGGAPAIMLVSPAQGLASRGEAEAASRAIGGFEEAGSYVALLGAGGEVLAATPGFEQLGLGQRALETLVADVATEKDRLLKRIVHTDGRALPVGFARLTDEPARHLLITVDEGGIEEPVRSEVSIGVVDDSQLAAIAQPPSAGEGDSAMASIHARAREPRLTGDEAGTTGGVAEEAEEAEAEAQPARGEAASANPDLPAVATMQEAPPAGAIGQTSTRGAVQHVSWYFSDRTAGGSQARGAAGQDAPLSFERTITPVRFVWRTNAEGRFSSISPEFASAVGAEASDVVGEGFAEIAKRFALDPDEEIVGLLARRDTWSGRSVLWPVAGTDLKVPVDLAALPAYGRDRQFEGFRGFGVVRGGEAIVDPDAIGLALVRPQAMPADAGAPAEPDGGAAEAEIPAAETDGPAAPDRSADPFEGEVPALEIAPKPRRRFSDKVIRLAEHRQPANDKGLTPLERNAFREIGEQLKRTSEVAPATKTESEDDSKLGVESAAGTPREDRHKKDQQSSGVPGAVDESTATRAGSETPADSAVARTTPVRTVSATDAPEWRAPLAEPAAGPIEAGAEGEPRAEAYIATDAEAPALNAASREFFEAQATPAEATTQSERLTQDQAPGERAGAAEIREVSTPENEAAAARAGDDAGAAADAVAQDPTSAGPALSQESAQVHGQAADAEAGSEIPEVADATPRDRISRSLLDFASAADNENTPMIDAPAANGEDASAADRDVADSVDRGAGATPHDTLGQAAPAAAPSEAPRDLVEQEAQAAPAAEAAGDGVEEASQVARQAEPPSPPLKQGGFLPSAFAERSEKRADTSILAQLPIPVLIHAGDTLHYANEAFFELTGYGSIEHFAEAGGLDALLSGPAADRKDGDNRVMLRTRQGDEFPVSAFLQSVPWLGGKALLLTLTRQPALSPASATPSAEDEDLRARLAELRTILDTATDGVVLIGNDGNVSSISRPAEALFGYDSHELVGKPFTSLFAIESQRAARDYLSGLSEHGVASVLNDGREVIGRESQGRFIPLFMTIGRLPGNGGYCAVLRDITQWKRAEEDLTQARAQAERTSTQKSDFLARVSHEIRTPLNAIIGFSELMLDEKFGPVANDRYRDYLRDINRSGNHVLDLVNDLLDISKIEAGQQEMDYEAVALNDALGETVAMMQPQANRERVIIRSSFASKLPEVVADLRSVRQIALNILSNAVRYTQAGGQVIVSTALEPNGEVVMRVRDTGIGMTQAEIEQALKPFKQVNALKRARGDGTGLGLPLTKAMVEANRAKFAIYSTPGEGTLVEVTFPSTRVLAE